MSGFACVSLKPIKINQYHPMTCRYSFITERTWLRLNFHSKGPWQRNCTLSIIIAFVWFLICRSKRNQSINWPFNLDLWWPFCTQTSSSLSFSVPHNFPNYLFNELQPLCFTAHKQQQRGLCQCCSNRERRCIWYRNDKIFIIPINQC